MNIDERLERLTSVVEAHTRQIEAHSGQIEAHSGQIEANSDQLKALIRVASEHHDQIQGLVRAAEALQAVTEEDREESQRHDASLRDIREVLNETSILWADLSR